MSLSPLLITGMHRSGTSLVARFVHLSGIDLGDELLGPRSSNRHGHFEDVGILAFHKGILLREGGHSMWIDALPRTGDQDRREAQQLVAAREHKPSWGWKDPRSALFLDFWHRLLPSARYLFLVRDPSAVLDSLARRHGTRFYSFRRHNRFLRAWSLYSRCCADFRQSHPARTRLVTLDQILAAPDRFVRMLSDLVAHPLETASFQALYDPALLGAGRDTRRLLDPRLLRRCTAEYEQMRAGSDLA